jgi:hypothetical protein
MAITAKNIGTNSLVIYYASTGTTEAQTMHNSGTAVGGIQGISWDLSNNMVDATNNDDAGSTSAEYGNRSCSFSIDCVFDPTDSAQASLLAAAFAKTKVCMAYAPVNGNNEDMYIFDALVETTGVTGGNDELITVSFSFVNDGTITRDTSWTT